MVSSWLSRGLAGPGAAMTSKRSNAVNRSAAAMSSDANECDSDDDGEAGKTMAMAMAYRDSHGQATTCRHGELGSKLSQAERARVIAIGNP